MRCPYPAPTLTPQMKLCRQKSAPQRMPAFCRKASFRPKTMATGTGCLISSWPEQFDTPEDFGFSGYVMWSQLLCPTQVRLGALDRYMIMLKLSILPRFPDAKSIKSACEAGHACNARSSPQHWFSKTTNTQERQGNGGKKTIIRNCDQQSDPG